VTAIARTMMNATTGQITAVNDSTPDRPSSPRLSAGFATPAVVAVETGRAAVRPACVASAATIPSTPATAGSMLTAWAVPSATRPPATGAMASPITCST
jgi:hypothetical protein